MKVFKFATYVAAAVLLTFTTAATSGSKVLCEGFVPPNDMQIPVGDYSHGIVGNGGLTEAQFNAVLDRIQTQFGDALKSKGATLVVNRLWTDATVNASAQQQGNQWIINMYGGLARHTDTTVEGFALVACHEMGHHLGGAPKIQQIFGGAWATNEGGADYYATLKCLRDFFSKDDNATIIANSTIDPVAKEKCLAQFSTQTDQDICMRNYLAGESVAYLFMDLRKETTKPRVDTPDATKVDKTVDEHPATQCRMDTYFAGSICPVKANMPNSDSDFKMGSCVEGADGMGFRPRCWFNPDGGNGGGGGGGGSGTCPFGDQSICDSICQIDPSQDFCKKIVN